MNIQTLKYLISFFMVYLYAISFYAQESDTTLKSGRLFMGIHSDVSIYSKDKNKNILSYSAYNYGMACSINYLIFKNVSANLIIGLNQRKQGYYVYEKNNYLNYEQYTFATEKYYGFQLGPGVLYSSILSKNLNYSIRGNLYIENIQLYSNSSYRYSTIDTITNFTSEPGSKSNTINPLTGKYLFSGVSISVGVLSGLYRSFHIESGVSLRTQGSVYQNSWGIAPVSTYHFMFGYYLNILLK
ncbi:MAG: hypothetical protein HND27_08320 [Bacteroidetes bacterium]|nr:hypothetical protein [Flavobacteriales bacterium]NOG95770.1 hypothetical protein [Bacteroidota bacterium]CAG0980348.1 hypothetical protein FLAV_01732 [Flavobacteriales bacterium]